VQDYGGGSGGGSDEELAAAEELAVDDDAVDELSVSSTNSVPFHTPTMPGTGAYPAVPGLPQPTAYDNGKP
jgi:hypothetical protein